MCYLAKYNETKEKCEKKPPNPPNARSFCQEVEKVKEQNAGITAMEALSYLNPIKAGTEFIKSIGDAFGSKAQTQQEIKSKFNIDLSVKQIEEINNDCKSYTNLSQTNSITGAKPECLQIILEFQKYLPDDQKMKIQDIQDLFSIKDIIQTNDAGIDINCITDKVLTVLASGDVTVDSTAVQESINKAKGLMSGSVSNQKGCTEVNQDLSTCSYTATKNCCLLNANITQSNILNAECSSVRNVTQKNIANISQQCSLQANTNLTNKGRSKLTISSTGKSDNSSEGFTIDFMIVILLIIAIVFGGGVGIFKSFTGTLKGKMLLIIGGILIALGIGTILYAYFSSQTIVKNEETVERHNQPYNMVKSSSFDADKRSTYGDCKKTLDNDKTKYVGYDFYSEEKNGSSPTDNQLGTCIMLKYVKKEDSPVLIEDTEGNVYSKTKQIESKADPTTPTICYVFGSISILLGMFFVYKFINNKSGNGVTAGIPAGGVTAGIPAGGKGVVRGGGGLNNGFNSLF